MRRLTNLPQKIAIFLLAIPLNAEAYIGPGAGIGAIGTVIALIGAIILAIVGFVWYPVKRYLQKRKQATNNLASQKEQNDEQEKPD